MNRTLLLFLLLIILFLDKTIQAGREFVLTGAPKCGKTTIIVQLANRGYQTTPEAPLCAFEKNTKTDDVDVTPIDHSELTYDVMLNKQLEAESSLDSNRPAFLDGSVIDIITLGHYYNIPISETIQEPIKKYDLIFFLDPLQESFREHSGIRNDAAKHLEDIDDVLKRAYMQKGHKKYQLINVPFDTPENRAQYIIDRMRSIYFYADVIDCFAGKNTLYPIQHFLGNIKHYTI